MRLASVGIIFCVGLVIALHFSMNAAVGKAVGNPRMANGLFWIIGACWAVVIGLSGWNSTFWREAANVPLWLWLAGVIGASMVFVIISLLPKLGAATTNIALLAGQVAGAILIAHFGFLGSRVEPINSVRLIGAAAMIVGAGLAVLGKVPFTR